MSNFDANGRIALVTGASAGIGFAVCRRLLGAGARVVMVARNRERLQAAAEKLGDEARAVPIVLDVGDLESLARLPAEVVARCGRLDVVVNNAGVHHRGGVLERTADELEEIVRVDLTAPIVLTRAAIPLLPRGGAVVQVASLSGYVPVPGAATYSAAKAGLRAFTRALRDEVRERGLTISLVSPGPVDTDFFRDELDRVAPLTFSQPMSSAGEVADAVVECLETGRAEIALPRTSGWLATLGYLSPSLFRLLRPRLERRGARRKAEYARRRQDPARRS